MTVSIDAEQADLETKVHELRTKMQEYFNTYDKLSAQWTMLTHSAIATARELGMWEERLAFAKFSKQISEQHNKPVGLIRATR